MQGRARIQQTEITSYQVMQERLIETRDLLSIATAIIFSKKELPEKSKKLFYDKLIEHGLLDNIPDS